MTSTSRSVVVLVFVAKLYLQNSFLVQLKGCEYQRGTLPHGFKFFACYLFYFQHVYECVHAQNQPRYNVYNIGDGICTYTVTQRK